ncbi:hypothetical protein BX666DRAFT_1962296 [Dichotomocladium elegans]|nr:hypothetical protein BX666DRAFT_1962296 [Dichotomocladium elegans]
MKEGRSQLQRLSQEIEDFVQYLAPTQRESKDRDNLFNDCTKIIQGLIPHCQVVPFGSYETGLLLPTSDVDLRIAFNDHELPENPKPILRKLNKALVKRFGFPNVELIFARVPVIKVDFRSSQGEPIHVDISIGNASLSSDRTLGWINEFSELKPIYLFLKSILLSVRLKDDPKYEIMSARLSGMAGYTLVCLIVHYIQNTVIPENRDRKSPEYLGQLLLDMLDFYSEWNYQEEEMVMDTVPGFVKKPFPTKNGKLEIRDPDDASLNVARSTTTMDRVQGVFKWITKEIRANMKEGTILRTLVSSDWKLGARTRHRSYTPRVLNLSAADIGVKIIQAAKDYGASNTRRNGGWKRKRPNMDQDAMDNNYSPRDPYRDSKRKRSYVDRDAADNNYFPRDRYRNVRRRY